MPSIYDHAKETEQEVEKKNIWFYVVGAVLSILIGLTVILIMSCLIAMIAVMWDWIFYVNQ